MASEKEPDASDVTSTTVWKSKKVPELGLENNLAYEYRVYVLECAAPSGARGPYFYVGIEHKSKIWLRLKQHFEHRGSHYTKSRAPNQIHLIWPAANTAVEAYVYAALSSQLPAGSAHRLGGWVQTSDAPSPLARMLFEQQRRMLKGVCLNCGGNHWASQCSKPIGGLEYTCPQCNEGLVISSRGQSVVAAKAKAPQAPLPPKMLAPSSSAPAVSAPAKRAASPSPAATTAKVAKVSNSGNMVLVCGKSYTSLAWFLGQPNPSPSICSKARAQCQGNALELNGGDFRTLVAHGYAKERLPGKELLPGRERLPGQWCDTAIKTDKGSVVRVRKAGEQLEKANRQVLWLLSDLERVFGDKKK